MSTTVALLFLIFGMFTICNVAFPEIPSSVIVAAEEGDADSQWTVGYAYQKGYFVAKDLAEAMKWYLKAAEQGVAYAQHNLGAMYANGEGVPQDFVYAYKWWNIAAAQGDEDSRKNIKILVEYMTKEQIAEAQKLSREWMAKRAETE